MKIKCICLLLSLILVASLASCSLLGGGLGTGNKERVVGTEKIINVYLIAGQSNAVGYGMDTGNRIGSSDERFTGGFDNVLYYGNHERWTGKNLDNGFEPVTLGMGVAKDRSGAEIGIANAIADYGEMNAVIKCAWGATHLYPDTQYDVSLKQGTWTSPTYIKNHNIDTSENPMIGNMYRRFEESVADALQLLIDDGYTPVIKGIWWMQGEAEMFTLEMASAYRELFETLIYDMRNTLGEITGYDCSKVPFICGLPKWNSKNSAPPTYQGMVRTAMTTVAQDVDNVGCVDCMPLNQHDDWHFDAAGQKYLGEAFVTLLETFEIENDSYFNERVSIDKEIKITSDGSGLEFRANLTNYDSNNGYEYGFVFVPTEKLRGSRINGDYIENLKASYIGYTQVSADVTVESIDGDYSDIYFSGRITDILYEDLNTSYTAIAYIKNPEGQYMYSGSSVGTSVAGLASREMYAEGADVAMLSKIVNEGINFLNGVPYESRDSEADFELILDKTLELGFTESGTRHQLAVGKSTDVDYFVKYTSDNPEVASVDKNGLITAKQKGSATITVECAGRSAEVEVTVTDFSMGGIVFDAVIGSGEYLGEVFSATNGNLSVRFAGMIKEGNLYLSFELTHGEWSPLNSSWWLNDNIEFKLNSGTSYTVIFYEGVATYSNNISYGVSETKAVDGRYVTTVELCVENVGESNIKIGFNGTNFNWLGALWNDYYEVASVTANGIVKK